jgi:hypothetical protein
MKYVNIEVQNLRKVLYKGLERTEKRKYCAGVRKAAMKLRERGKNTQDMQAKLTAGSVPPC